MTSDLPPPVPLSAPGYPPAPYAPIYAYRDQRKKDLDQLRLLSIFSYVSAALAVLGIGFLVFHYNMMRMFTDNPQFWNQPSGQHSPAGMMRREAAPPDLRQFFEIFRWFYLVFGLWGIVMSVLNAVSGYGLSQRRHRMFSLVVAALNCLRLPLGTVLGIFTLVVLTRDSVRGLYEGGDAAPAAPTRGGASV